MMLHGIHCQVEIRVNEDAPSYPTAVDGDLVPLGRLPLGGDARSSRGAEYDRRSASEGGCSSGPQEGCTIYNIKVSAQCGQYYHETRKRRRQWEVFRNVRT